MQGQIGDRDCDLTESNPSRMEMEWLDGQLREERRRRRGRSRERERAHMQLGRG